MPALFLFLVLMALLLVSPATAAVEPFGQETVDVRPWRNPPRPGARPTHRHRHSAQPAGAHDHDHRPGALRHTHSRSGEHGHIHAPNGHAHHGVETEHLFGFTKGTDIDPPGTKHLIADWDGRFGKQTGSYAATSLHLEYGFVPVRDVHIGLGASFGSHSIIEVEGLDDRRQFAFERFSIDLRKRLLDRAQAPFGLTVMVEPHWARLDEASGERANKFALEVVLAADKELIKDRLYGALNFIYEPEWVRIKSTGEMERESTIGISAAAMTPIAPSLFVGGEVRYLRSYEGVALNAFAGEAVFAGPIVFVDLNHTIKLVAAYSGQVAGRAAGAGWGLDLENFERHRGKLKAVIHF